MKKKALIFGAGDNFRYSKHYIAEHFDIVGLIDNSPDKQGKEVRGFAVQPFAKIDDFIYDVILVTPSSNKDILKQLSAYGIPNKKVLEFERVFSPIFSGEKLNIAFALFGGMGDLLIGKNWIYHLSKVYGLNDCIIDIFVDEHNLETCKSIFDRDASINRIININEHYEILENSDDYDIVILFSIFPYLYSHNCLYEKIAQLKPDFFEYIIELEKFSLQNFHFGFSYSPFYYKSIRRLFEAYTGKNYYSFCDFLGNLGISEQYLYSLPISCDETEYLASVGLKPKDFITIDTGINYIYKDKGNTRSWAHESWNQLAKMIRANHPGISVVQIGAKMSDNDDINADINLNGKTDLEAAKVLLKNALLHIDYEGGLVHLRHILGGGTSIVLLGSTNLRWHEYSENINIRTDACEEGCEWTTIDWGFNCPKGYKYPVCMSSITSEIVNAKVDEFLLNQGVIE